MTRWMFIRIYNHDNSNTYANKLILILVYKHQYAKVTSSHHISEGNIGYFYINM